MSGVPPVREIPQRDGGRSGGLSIGKIFVGLFVVFLCIVVPAILLLPAVGASREAARRNRCLGNLRSLAIVVQNHESAHGVYPTASDGSTDLVAAQTAGGRGEAPSASDDGYSWLYQTLPYYEEEQLYNEIKKAHAEDDAPTGPFDEDRRAVQQNYYVNTAMDLLRCPSYSGDRVTKLSGVDVSVVNYCAIVGTDLSDPDSAPWKTSANWENGGLPSACWSKANSRTTATMTGACTAAGIRRQDMADGISKTMIFVESRESLFSAWISGSCLWVVAATPNSLALDRVTIGPGSDGFIAAQGDENGLALNFGSDDWHPDPSESYLGRSDWAKGLSRAWGPSSEHSGDGVIHAFADAHARFISADADPTVYLRLVTRAGSDRASEDDLDDY